MKALIKKESGEGIWLDEVAQPEAGRNDVLIKVDRTGICGTDLHIYKWDDWASKTVPIPLVDTCRPRSVSVSYANDTLMIHVRYM